MRTETAKDCEGPGKSQVLVLKEMQPETPQAFKETAVRVAGGRGRRDRKVGGSYLQRLKVSGQIGLRVGEGPSPHF